MAGPAANAIDQGSLRAIWNAQPGDEQQAPIVQCVQIKAMGQPGAERYRVVFSDIRNFIQGLIATQSASIVVDGRLKKGSIVRLTQYNPQVVKGKKIIIVLSLDVLSEYGELDKIGEPVALDNKGEEDEDVKQPAAIASNGFYGEKPSQQIQQQQRALPARTNGAPNNSSSSHGNLYPIEALSPYAHRWTIKVRCTAKPPIKTWHKASGEGKLFSVNFLDDSGEIRATGFNEQCDTLYDIFEEGSVYYISSPCKVQLAKKQFSNLNNDYELVFERDTVVEKAEQQEDVPQIRYNFTNIGDLQSVEKDTTIDTIGVLKEVDEVNEIISKTTQKHYNKRELTLVDDTMHSVRLTIWGDSASNFNIPLETVVAFKGVKVSDFGGRSLSLLSSGSMTVSPDIEQAHKLKGWYDAQGGQQNFQTHANLATMGGATNSRRDVYKTISEVREENLGMSETPDFFSLKATVLYIKQENFAYPACRTDIDGRKCSKKVVETDPGQWRCEKCDKAWDKPEHRYIMQLNVSDHTGQLWLSCFDETGRMILGMSADQLTDMKENGDPHRVEDTFTEAACKTFVFKCRASMDNFQDQQRIRYQVSFANPLNYSVECQKLTELIKQYQLEDDSLFVRG